MTAITLKGNTINTVGELPKVGETAKDFKLVKADLERVSLADYKGKVLVFNIFPSIDTGTCAMSVRTFNKKAAELDNTVVLCISRDLPFAHKRFCAAEGIENVITASDFESGKFGKDYGLEISDSGMAGLHSRCVIVVDESGKIVYTEQVSEVSEEPNYDSALKAINQLSVS